ncbi:hypothetical protein SDC9_76556 [bioreactor metagenome]|uniref:Secretion system C-terminal sorting domain-containing protein n=1 Tax=bioreactor metagenome TaxID=1076179 RepID=A0A644YVF8_9ZZZZ
MDCKTDWSNAAESNVIQITTDSVMPAFSFATVYCQDDAELTLPASSDNGITGTWTPATIATTVPGSAEYTFTPDAGQCAKVVKTTVIINSKTTSTVTVSSCASYNWFGTDYTTSGSYTHVIANAAGCDSTITLNLTIFPDYSFIENQSICSGDTFTWRGNDYSIAGTYTDSYTSINGCDSIYTLNLTVNPTYAFSESETICNGDTLIWQGNNYTAAGIYTASYTTINGCDSIYTLNLTVNPSYAFAENLSVCNGDTLQWQGNNYSVAGTYTAAYTTINGCDSIYTLNLTVNPVYAFTQDQAICNGDIYNWQGNDYSVAGTYTAAYTSITGCDSLYTLNLVVNTVDITVTENDPSISANLAGAVYQWLNCGNSFAPVAGETAQNFTATQNGNYAVMITEGLCTDTSECVTISTVGIENQAAAQIRLYPNPVTDKLVIEYPENDKNTAFIIQNVTGQIVFRGDLVEKTIVSTEELAPGTYVIRFENNTVMQFIKAAE